MEYVIFVEYQVFKKLFLGTHYVRVNKIDKYPCRCIFIVQEMRDKLCMLGSVRKKAKISNEEKESRRKSNYNYQ